jgi:hypothetical protein
MELVYLLAYGMLVKRTAVSGFWSLFGTVWTHVFTKNGGYLACLRDWIPSQDAINRRFN